MENSCGCIYYPWSVQNGAILNASSCRCRHAAGILDFLHSRLFPVMDLRLPLRRASAAAAHILCCITLSQRENTPYIVFPSHLSNCSMHTRIDTEHDRPHCPHSLWPLCTAGLAHFNLSYCSFRFPLFQEKPPDHRKPQDMACRQLQNTSSRHKRSRNDPLLWLAMIFLFPIYGIFPETGKTGFRALRVFPVATTAASDENSHRTSPDRAT